MLYRGAARFVGTAVDAIEAENVPAAHNSLVRAQAVISELLETLDLERGGDLARNLMQIYEYMNYRLVEANLRKDTQPAREVERLRGRSRGAVEVPLDPGDAVPRVHRRIAVDRIVVEDAEDLRHGSAFHNRKGKYAFTRQAATPYQIWRARTRPLPFALETAAQSLS